MRIDKLKNDFNVYESAFDVDLYKTDIRDFIVITEPHDNPGPSITNAAETICPQIAMALELVWKRCVFIESYPADSRRGGLQPYDPTFDLIRFSREPEERYLSYRRNTIPYARLANPGWRPLPLDLAKALQAAGCSMSRIIGLEADFWSDHNNRGGRYRINAYDGRAYYTSGGEFLQHDIRYVWGLDPKHDAFRRRA